MLNFGKGTYYHEVVDKPRRQHRNMLIVLYCMLGLAVVVISTMLGGLF